MSIPTAVINNRRTYPGIAAKLNVNHPAAQQVRLAAVAIGGLDGVIFSGNMMNLVNNIKGTQGAGSTQKARNTSAGPGIGNNTGTLTWVPTITETIFSYTFAAIFVAAVETATRSLLSYLTAKLTVAAAGLAQIVMNGTIQTITPALPALITGHTYFFAFSTAAAPKSNCILADLTNGQIYAGTFPTNVSIALTAGSGVWGVNSAIVSQVNALSISALYLNPQQLMNWAIQDPWSLWYDRSMQNVMMMALHGAAAVGAKYAPLRQYLRR